MIHYTKTKISFYSIVKIKKMSILFNYENKNKNYGICLLER